MWQELMGKGGARAPVSRPIAREGLAINEGDLLSGEPKNGLPFGENV